MTARADARPLYSLSTVNWITAVFMVLFHVAAVASFFFFSWANVLTALPFGITTFDASAGGLGGCPYAPGAAGNLATEDLLYMLDGLGIDTGVSLSQVAHASRFIATKLDHALPSRFLQAPQLRTAG